MEMEADRNAAKRRTNSHTGSSGAGRHPPPSKKGILSSWLRWLSFHTVVSLYDEKDLRDIFCPAMVLVVDGRQPALLLVLAEQKITSQIFPTL